MEASDTKKARSRRRRRHRRESELSANKPTQKEIFSAPSNSFTTGVARATQHKSRDERLRKEARAAKKRRKATRSLENEVTFSDDAEFSDEDRDLAIAKLDKNSMKQKQSSRRVDDPMATVDNLISEQLKKLRKVIKKYKSSSGIKLAGLAESLKNENTQTNSFFSFAHRYFASTDIDYLEGLTKVLVKEMITSKKKKKKKKDKNSAQESRELDSLPQSGPQDLLDEKRDGVETLRISQTEVEDKALTLRENPNMSLEPRPLVHPSDKSPQAIAVGKISSSRQKTVPKAVEEIDAFKTTKSKATSKLSQQVEPGSTSKRANRDMNEYESAHREYARQEKPEYVSGRLTKAEQETVELAVENYCTAHDMSRLDFANYLWTTDRGTGRMAKQIFNANFLYLFPYRKSKNMLSYMKRAYQPDTHRGKFTMEEDRRILELQQEKGNDWSAIAGQMGRFPGDVRDRYRNYLVTPDCQEKSWSKAEVELLKRLVGSAKADGSEIHYAAIAEQIGTRNRIQCRDKYYQLNKAGAFSEEDSGTVLSRKRTDSVEGPQSSQKRRRIAAILSGDKLHFLKIVKNSNASTLEEVFSRGEFNMYNGVFEESKIAAALIASLSIGSATPLAVPLNRQDIDERIRVLKQMGRSELRRTIVDDSDSD